MLVDIVLMLGSIFFNDHCERHSSQIKVHTMFLGEMLALAQNEWVH